jgi:hypothetical protein
VHVLQAVQLFFDVGRRPIKHTRQHCGVELVSLHARDGQHAAGVFVQAPDDAVNQASNRFRDVLLDRRHRLDQRPAFGLACNDSARAELAKDVHHEQWVAFGLPKNERRKILRKRMLGKLKREIRVHIAAFEQRHGNFATTHSRLQLESQRRERMIGQKQIGRPKRRNDQDPHRVETRRQIAQEVDGRRVSPVDIVEKQDDRELARHLMEQCAELPLETLGRSRAHLDTLLDRIAAAAGGKQVFVPGRRHRFRQPGERVGVLGAKQAVERLEDRQIRFGPSEALRTAASGDPASSAPAGQFRQEVFDERRLADAGFARNRDHSAASCGRAFEGCPQFGPFAIAADAFPLELAPSDRSGRCRATLQIGKFGHHVLRGRASPGIAIEHPHHHTVERFGDRGIQAGR